jgi:hypothetical protein
MTLFVSLSNLPTKFHNVSMVITWPSIVHLKKPIWTNLGTFGPSTNIVHARRMFSHSLLNDVSLALSQMQASHSSSSHQRMVGWLGSHLGCTSCMKIVHLYQYWRMVMGLVTCWTCSKARLVDERSNFKMFTIRNFINGQLICSLCWTTRHVGGQQMCNNTMSMWTRYFKNKIWTIASRYKLSI